MNSFPHFILLFDKVFFFFFCPEMRHKASMEHAHFIHILMRRPLGSYHKVNSYTIITFYIYILRLLHKLPHLPALRGEVKL